VGVAAAVAIFGAGLSLGVRLGSTAGPASSGQPSGVVASGSASASQTDLAAIDSASPSAAESASTAIDSPSPSAVKSASAAAPCVPAAADVRMRPRLLAWFGQSIVVQSAASGKNQVELWAKTGSGKTLMALPGAGEGATAYAASDGTTLLVDSGGPTVTIFAADLKPKQVVVGTAAPGRSCREDASPFAQMADGGYFTSGPGSITVIGKDGAVATKPVPAKWTVIGAVLDGDGLLVRDANSNPLDYVAYEVDRTTGATDKVNDHVNGYQPGAQVTIDYTTFGYMSRTDWSWWTMAYQMPNLITVWGLPVKSIGTVSKAYFDPTSGLLAEQATSGGKLLITDTSTIGMADEARKPFASIDGPVYDVVVTDGTMAVSANGGCYLVTKAGVQKLPVPSVAPIS
jgi:hypothetical protein